MKNIKKIVLSVIAMCLFIGSLFAVGALASEPVDAMADIEKNLAQRYRVLEPTVISDDGYIGIPVEYSVYFDKGANGNKKAVPGFTVNGGTPLALYIVNTATERVGKDSDTEIITSLLQRGFIVAVLDYMNSPRTVSPCCAVIFICLYLRYLPKMTACFSRVSGVIQS